MTAMKRLALVALPCWWRRAATIGLGVVAFAIILFIGHTLGLWLALRA